MSSFQAAPISPDYLDSEAPSSNLKRNFSILHPASSLLETREKFSTEDSCFLSMSSMDFLKEKLPSLQPKEKETSTTPDFSTRKKTKSSNSRKKSKTSKKD